MVWDITSIGKVADIVMTMNDTAIILFVFFLCCILSGIMVLVDICMLVAFSPAKILF
jgi:hypothetical protein